MREDDCHLNPQDDSCRGQQHLCKELASSRLYPKHHHLFRRQGILGGWFIGYPDMLPQPSDLGRGRYFGSIGRDQPRWLFG